MRGIIIAIVVIVVAFFTYLLFEQSDSLHTEIIDEPSSVITASGISESGNIDKNIILEKEASDFVSNLTLDNEKNVEIKSADDFVLGQQPLSFDENQQIELASIDELVADKSLSGDSPITLIKDQQQIEILSLSSIIKQAKGNLNKKILILENGKITEYIISELIEKFNNNLNQKIEIIRNTEHYEITTVDSLLNDPGLDGSKPLKIIRQPYRLKSTTIDELLMSENVVDNGNVYYVRNVNMDDDQGIWGIVHDGLVKNFAAGIAIKRSEKIEKYQVDIPVNADERQKDNSSSFLGKMIERKTSESFVYNYDKGKMGKNPDLIYPGQELVIIRFTPEELIQIYQHFVTRSQS